LTIRIVCPDFSALADDLTEWRWEILSGDLQKKKSTIISSNIPQKVRRLEILTLYLRQD
jgi:hypothetical protein